MRKNRLLSAALVLILTGSLVLAFAGCGEKEEPIDETTPTTEGTEEESLLEDPEYDISNVLANAGLIEALDATGVEYTLENSTTTVEEVAINTGSEELDGVAGTFMAFAQDDKAYESFPDYQIAGEKDGITYILMLPTDVRYDANDPQQTADYEKLTETLKAFVIR